MTPPKNKKNPNFQDLFSFEDYKLAFEAKHTYNCGISPICLRAPEQHYCIHTDVISGRKASSASITFRTIKLEYAIQVWMRAALVSSQNPGPLLYYWWLHYEDNDTSFREIKYSKNWWGATPEAVIDGFWKLLEEIANSGEVRVCEGYSFTNRTGRYITDPKPEFVVVLDDNDIHNAHRRIKDVFSYGYNTHLRSFSWEEIRDMFIQLNLKQLSLIDQEQLHKHTSIDDILFKACSMMDIDAVKTAVRLGANVNALDKNGESPLQHVIDHFEEHFIDYDKKYTPEERSELEKKAYDIAIVIVDYLLDQGADIDLFGVEGMQPLLCAYYTHSVDMVRHLLKCGSNPNYNSYRYDDVFIHGIEKVRCSVLEVIHDDMYDEYDDVEKEIEDLVYKHGGRRLIWDYDEERYEHLGKYYLLIKPDYDKWLFTDNDWRGVGNFQSVTVEDSEGNLTTIDLSSISGLNDWHREYHENLNAVGFDWAEWNRRGYDLVRQVAALLPEYVALFYPYEESDNVEYNERKKCYLPVEMSEKIRIK